MVLLTIGPHLQTRRMEARWLAQYTMTGIRTTHPTGLLAILRATEFTKSAEKLATIHKANT